MPASAKGKKKDPAKRPKQTPIKQVVALAAAGNNRTQIAKKVNVSKQAVSALLKRYQIDDKVLESFKVHRADIMAGLQETALASLSDSDIRCASVKDRTMLFAILYDKERLERGLSTQNSSVLLASAVIEAANVRRAKPLTPANEEAASVEE